jgi:hypothetical protein
LNFLGEEEELTKEEVAQVVGELANMLCGSVVSKIKGRSKFVLSHPEELKAMPSLAAEDALVSLLATDSGVLTTWVVVEGNA